MVSEQGASRGGGLGRLRHLGLAAIPALALAASASAIALLPPALFPSEDLPAARLLAYRGGMASGQPFVIEGGWRFDTASGEMVRNDGIVIRAGRLVDVAAEAGSPSRDGARLIRLSDDDYVLPGLIDLHAHYEVALAGTGRVDEHVVNPVIFLANGVTSTFPAGESNPEEMREARRRIDSGAAVGPRILSSGPRFGPQWDGWDESASPEDVRRLVDHWVDQGVVGFKAKGTTAEQLQALIEQAHRHGRTVTGHLMSLDTLNPQTGVLLGIDRIEHYLGGRGFPADEYVYDSLERFRPDTPEFQEILELFLERRVYFTPTITAFGYLGNREDVFDRWVDERSFFTPYVQEHVRSAAPRNVHPRWDAVQRSHRRTVKAFHDAGGGELITMGTDTPARGEFLAGFNAHRELHNFVLAGIPPAYAIRFATINGARALGLGDLLGSIETGKLADLFVVRGNPLDDITHTRNVRLVIKAGEVYDPAELLRSVQGRLGPTGPPRAVEP